ncbi:MAG: bifunctional serine/threonine-protein kinase/formylglycine-generating enzyme family protein [Planctomycetota bacterium]
MTRPSTRILSECLREPDWQAAVERACQTHAEHADDVQRQLACLLRSGLWSTSDEDWGRSRALLSSLFAGRAMRQPVTASNLERSDAVLGRFCNLREIGRGGQAIVYVADDLRRGVQVALKATPLVAGGDRHLERVQREVRLAARIYHPGVCRVDDVAEEDGVLWAVMQYVAGDTLRDRLRARAAQERGGVPALQNLPNPQEMDRAVRLVLAVAEALQAAHDADVVHRDLKPENIVVTESGRPVILDLGLGRDLSGDLRTLTRSGELLGTLAYMAPEQVAGGAADARTDVYALAVILFECVGLRRPFEASTEYALARRILRSDAPDVRSANPRATRNLAAVLHKALEADPARRYPSARGFAEDLERLSQGAPVHARPMGPVERVLRTARRHPKWALCSGGIAAVLACAIAVLFWFAASRDLAVRELRLVWDGPLAVALEREAEGLWPARAAQVPRFEDWLSRARPLLGRFGGYRESLRRLPHSSANASERADLQEAVAGLEGFQGVVRRIERRRDAARAVRMATVGSTEAQRAWARAVERVGRNPRYRAPFELSPQIGLVPLDRDPVSGLEEFGHWLSGTIPRRGQDGRLSITAETGLVFVLVPGGRLLMGRQNDDPDAANYDEEARVYDRPHAVDLDPFLLSKYEMTQAQWLRITGRNPSLLAADKVQGITWLHPVEGLNWAIATRVLSHLELGLPTSAQWEWACRAGTDTAFYAGPSIADLAGHANIAGREARDIVNPHMTPDDDFADPFELHAPVNALAANSFGFHHMAGNVFELCKDWYRRNAYEFPVLPGTGERAIERSHAGMRMLRGGSFAAPAKYARSGRFGSHGQDNSPKRDCGVRPARHLSDAPR